MGRTAPSAFPPPSLCPSSAFPLPRCHDAPPPALPLPACLRLTAAAFATRTGCAFERFFQTTPQELINNRLYSRIAVAFLPNEHRQVRLPPHAPRGGGRSGGGLAPRSLAASAPILRPTALPASTAAAAWLLSLAQVGFCLLAKDLGATRNRLADMCFARSKTKLRKGKDAAVARRAGRAEPLPPPTPVCPLRVPV